MEGCDSIDTDPRTPLLWVAVTLEDGTFRAVEVDAHDLSVLHVSEVNGGVCGAKVGAISNGMWAGFPTGLLSAALRFDASTGESGATLHSADGRYQEPNSAVYEAAPTALWVLSGRSLACADVDSGLVIGNSDLGEPWRSTMAVGERLVFVGQPQGVTIYTPTSVCSGTDQ
jgi:hypothetical protein